MQFEYDPEMLIAAVKKRPGIWDFENPEYRSKTSRHLLWLQVVKEVGGDVNVSKSEMRELELQLQKKWKSLRDCFQKYVTNPQRTKRPYIYCRQLEFLLKNQNMQGTPGAEVSDSDDPRPRKRAWKSIRKIKLTKMSSDEEPEFLEDPPSSNDGGEVAEASPQKMLNEFVFANVDSATKESSDDPDRMFLLSLLPHLKSIPEEFRLNIKMELMQVLRNASFQFEDQKVANNFL